jgi:WhiB family redox-sensing transcriptional regulator
MNYYEDWTEEGICRQTDPEAFYPEKGGDGGSSAVAICQGCPVRRQCLNTAMRAELNHGRPQRMGIWGGLTPSRRAKYEPQWLAEQEAEVAA